MCAFYLLISATCHPQQQDKSNEPERLASTTEEPAISFSLSEWQRDRPDVPVFTETGRDLKISLTDLYQNHNTSSPSDVSQNVVPPETACW